MAIDKQQFVDAGATMMIPKEQLRHDRQAADLDGNGAIDGTEEFAKLQQIIEQGGGSLDNVAKKMVQAGARRATSLGTRKLQAVPELQAVWSGLGMVVKKSGISLGAKPVQEALNKISDSLPDYKCHVGDADGKFGRNTAAGVSEFQRVNGLPETGKVNARTLHKLSEVLERARSLQVNSPSGDMGNVPGSLQMVSYGTRFPANKVALTFDDGPDPDTEKVLNALKAANIKGAIFFVQGTNVKSRPDLVRRIVREGHLLGNHTWDHPDLSKCSATKVGRQLDKCQAAIDEALGEHYETKHMRPPYGAINARAKGVIARKGLSVNLWQIDTNDWRKENRREPSNMLPNIFNSQGRLKKPGLLLMHDIHPSSGNFLPTIIRELQTAGVEIMPFQKLFETVFPA